MAWSHLKTVLNTDCVKVLLHRFISATIRQAVSAVPLLWNLITFPLLAFLLPDPLLPVHFLILSTVTKHFSLPARPKFARAERVISDATLPNYPSGSLYQQCQNLDLLNHCWPLGYNVRLEIYDISPAVGIFLLLFSSLYTSTYCGQVW